MGSARLGAEGGGKSEVTREFDETSMCRWAVQGLELKGSFDIAQPPGSICLGPPLGGGRASVTAAGGTHLRGSCWEHSLWGSCWGTSVWGSCWGTSVWGSCWGTSVWGQSLGRQASGAAAGERLSGAAARKHVSGAAAGGPLSGGGCWGASVWGGSCWGGIRLGGSCRGGIRLGAAAGGNTSGAAAPTHGPEEDIFSQNYFYYGNSSIFEKTVAPTLLVSFQRWEGGAPLGQLLQPMAQKKRFF